MEENFGLFILLLCLSDSLIHLRSSLDSKALSLVLGGHIGFDKKVWQVSEYKKGDNPSITFKYHSADGEEGN